MPALAITMSIPPNRSMALSAAACIADSSRTSATTVSTRSSPSRLVTSLSWPSSRSVNTSLAPLACRRRATSAPMPFAPPMIRATFPFTEPIMTKRTPPQHATGRLGVLEIHSEQRVDRHCHRPRRIGVLDPVFECVCGPTIKSGKRFRGIEAVGKILAHPGQDVGCVGSGGHARRRAPPGEPRDCLVKHRIAPRPVGAIVTREQAEPNRRRFDAVGAQPRYQDEVAAALAHLVPVPADHPGVHVVPSESPLPRYGFGVRGGELVVWEDQIAAAALDVQTGADAGQRDRRTFDVPAGPAWAERR